MLLAGGALRVRDQGTLRVWGPRQTSTSGSLCTHTNPQASTAEPTQLGEGWTTGIQYILEPSTEPASLPVLGKLGKTISLCPLFLLQERLCPHGYVLTPTAH